MSRCAFLIDECLPSSINRGLMRRIADVDVLRVGESLAPPISSTDAVLLAYCQTHQRMLVTADRVTMPDEIARFLEAGHSTWGVLIVRPKSSLSQILDDLEIVDRSSEAEEWVDVNDYIPF